MTCPAADASSSSRFAFLRLAHLPFAPTRAADTRQGGVLQNVRL